MTFSVILADPPWQYADRWVCNAKNGNTSEATDHYPTMSMPELEQLEVKALAAKDCLLFMWTTGPQMGNALQLMKSWGFRYSTVAFVWNKGRPVMGSYTMSECEFCLVGKRGRIPKGKVLHNVRQYFQEARTVHSKKPNHVHEQLDAMFPDCAKVELFARRAYSGWEVWGNQVQSTVAVPAAPTCP